VYPGTQDWTPFFLFVAAVLLFFVAVIVPGAGGLVYRMVKGYPPRSLFVRITMGLSTGVVCLIAVVVVLVMILA
jgi:hypothetical protein